MKPLAVIPARGGSVRIPRKNIMELNGRPALSYPVSASIKSGLFGSILVSTEDPEIEKIAIDSGASVAKRDVSLSGGDTTIHNVVHELLERHYAQSNTPDYFCIIYATAVLLEAKHLKESFQLLIESQADAVLAVQKFNLHPFKALGVSGDELEPAFPEKFRLKSQCFPNHYAPAGAFHWMKTESFLSNSADIWPMKRRAYILNPHEAVDLDEPSDIELAKRLLIAKEHMS